MSSLLNHIAASISHSTEDIATMGLAYILEHSKSAKAALIKLVSDELGAALDSDLSFDVQSVGENRERPDMTATNTDGVEVLLFEVKFWATLTNNQPNTYLGRVKKNNGAALTFICPHERRISISSELCERSGYKDSGNGKLLVLADMPPMLILSWESVIGALESVVKEPGLKDDVAQLAELVYEQGRQDFRPFTDADLHPDTAARFIDYCDIVDKVADTLIADGVCNAKGLQATATKGAYKRYLRTNDGRFGLGVAFDCHAWRDNGISPFWVSVQPTTPDGASWGASTNYKKPFESQGFKYYEFPGIAKKVAYVPLHAAPELNEYVLVKEIAGQIKRILGVLQ